MKKFISSKQIAISCEQIGQLHLKRTCTDEKKMPGNRFVSCGSFWFDEKFESAKAREERQGRTTGVNLAAGEDWLAVSQRRVRGKRGWSLNLCTTPPTHLLLVECGSCVLHSVGSAPTKCCFFSRVFLRHFGLVENQFFNVGFGFVSLTVYGYVLFRFLYWNFFQVTLFRFEIVQETGPISHLPRACELAPGELSRAK